MIKFSLNNRNKKPEYPGKAGRPWYDTKEGTEESIKSLEGLYELVKLRHTAGYQFDQQLNEFYILGRYWLDTCGNCSKAEGFIPAEKFPGIPTVLTRDEFWSYIKENSKSGSNTMISFSFEDDLPIPNLKCAHCGNIWTIADCHDTVVWHKTEVFPLAEFVGKTLGDVKKSFSRRSNAIFRMQSDILIRNDRFIDLSPKYPDATKDWEKEMVKNERGWVSEKEGITDEYVIQAGDEGFFNVWTYYHRKCNTADLDAEYERKFREIFQKAGFKDIRMLRTANEYCPCEKCACWFNVNTEFGTVKIGWRKRVINIEGKGIMNENMRFTGSNKNFISLFPRENVTKGDTYIHAWGWEKAEKYIARIHSELAQAM